MRVHRPLASLVALLLLMSGCIGFKHPLGPVSSGFIEPRLLGTWDCTSADDKKPGKMTILDFDGRQYYFGSVDESGQQGHARAYATRVGGEPFLNFVEVGGGGKEPGWMLAHYTFSGDNNLALRLVDPKPFEKIVDSASRVRKLLERRRGDSSLYIDWCSCVRETASQ